MEYVFDTTRAAVNLVFSGATSAFHASVSCLPTRVG
jgi:hypothetical protein